MSDLRRERLLRLGDNALILSHRLSEWCGRAPVLEEDIALANIALDLIGQARMWLDLAATEDETADDLAFRRDVWDFRNLLLVERPNGNFGHTMMRQFLFDAFHLEQLRALEDDEHSTIAEVAAKAVREVTYHRDRSTATVIALGDGTDESHRRMQTALDRLWPFVGEMFVADPVDDPSGLRAAWEAHVLPAFGEATLTVPETDFTQLGGKTGRRHSEHLGHLLATMQWLPRAYPDARW